MTTIFLWTFIIVTLIQCVITICEIFLLYKKKQPLDIKYPSIFKRFDRKILCESDLKNSHLKFDPSAWAEKKKYQASVKVMRSYDYCHFEISINRDDLSSIKAINSVRIEAAKLVDRAVDDYKKYKQSIAHSERNSFERSDLINKVKIIKENYPQSEWTPEQKATVKRLEDLEFADRFEYNSEFDEF